MEGTHRMEWKKTEDEDENGPWQIACLPLLSGFPTREAGLLLRFVLGNLIDGWMKDG